jgi:glycine/D-amino acid oxidase-like deaminating enzyme
VTRARHTAVAVVGGGVLGCSAALHLKLCGCDGVILLERDRIGGGTSSAGAGLLARWSAGFVPAWGEQELALETYGLDFYRALSEVGNELGYRENGILFLGSARPSGPKSLRPLTSHGVEGLGALAPSEVEELTEGFVRGAGIAGGVFDPRAAQLSAGAAARALARRFVRLGGANLEHEPVASIRRRGGGFVLGTGAGTVTCQKLVVAAGGWTNAILRSFDTWLPVVPLVATRLTTKGLQVPSTLPAIQFCDGHRLYAREDDGPLAWGCSYEGEPRYAFVERDVPTRLDRLPRACVAEMQQAAQHLADALPGLSSAGVARAAHGAVCFSPDLKPLIGELSSAPGVYVLTGDNYAGVTHAPGAGRLLAELVTDTKDLSVDPNPYRPERFDDEYRNGAEVVAGMRWTAARTVLTARARTS